MASMIKGFGLISAAQEPILIEDYWGLSTTKSSIHHDCTAWTISGDTKQRQQLESPSGCRSALPMHEMCSKAIIETIVKRHDILTAGYLPLTQTPPKTACPSHLMPYPTAVLSCSRASCCCLASSSCCARRSSHKLAHRNTM